MKRNAMYNYIIHPFSITDQEFMKITLEGESYTTYNMICKKQISTKISNEIITAKTMK